MNLLTYIEPEEAISQSGFTIFGMEHIGILVAIGIIVAMMCYFYRRLGPKRGKFMLIIPATLAILQYMTEQIILIATLDHYPLDELPFELCRLFIFLNFIYAVKPNEYIGELLYCLGLPGALMALITPSWSAYPLFNFFNIYSFALHLWLISVPMMSIVSGQLRPHYKNFWIPLAFIGIVAPPLYCLNRAIGTNFLFLITPPANTPLAFIASIAGEKLYLLGFGVLVAMVLFILHLPWIIYDRVKRKSY
jgi:hypothetical integral membrane protein (TIGR02206 family)